MVLGSTFFAGSTLCQSQKHIKPKESQDNVNHLVRETGKENLSGWRRSGKCSVVNSNGVLGMFYENSVQIDGKYVKKLHYQYINSKGELLLSKYVNYNLNDPSPGKISTSHGDFFVMGDEYVIIFDEKGNIKNKLFTGKGWIYRDAGYTDANKQKVVVSLENSENKLMSIFWDLSTGDYKWWNTKYEPNRMLAHATGKAKFIEFYTHEYSEYDDLFIRYLFCTKDVNKGFAGENSFLETFTLMDEIPYSSTYAHQYVKLKDGGIAVGITTEAYKYMDSEVTFYFRMLGPGTNYELKSAEIQDFGIEKILKPFETDLYINFPITGWFKDDSGKQIKAALLLRFSKKGEYLGFTEVVKSGSYGTNNEKYYSWIKNMESPVFYDPSTKEIIYTNVGKDYWDLLSFKLAID